MFICGSSSFSHHDEKDDHDHNSPSPSPKRSKNSNKNPYADRGLDKFYALLADLDNKKRSIYTRQGSDAISLVSFVYTDDSNRIKPIVVKAKKSFKSSTSNINQDSADEAISTSKSTPDQEKPRKKRRSFRCKGSFKLNNLRHPFFYFPVMVFLILLFLAMYGRSFAIMCATIVWYVCPTVVIGGNSPSSSTSSSSSTLSINKRKPKRKQSHVRKKINYVHTY